MIEQVPFFAGLSDDEVERIAALFKERRFAAGETVTKEGAGGAAFFVIDSGEATVTHPRRRASRRWPRRPLRRDRAHRRGRALGDGHRDDRPRLPRPHVLGVPAARAGERRDRLEAAPDDGADAARRRGDTRRSARLRGEVGLPVGVDGAGAGHDPEVGLAARAVGARRRSPTSERSRSSLRELHDRHDATTLSQACGPAARAGHHVVDVLGRRGCSTGSGGRRGRRRPGARAAPGCGTAPARSGAAGSPTGTGSSARSECRTRAVARDDLRLLLQHEHDGPAHGHDAERLEAGVEQQGSSQASATSTGCGHGSGAGRIDGESTGAPATPRLRHVARHHSR